MRLINFNRLRGIAIIITILVIIIIGRLANLQIIQNEELSRQAVKQRAVETTLKEFRGNIYDRNMIPFTDTEDRIYIIVIPNLFKSFDEISTALSELSGYKKSQVLEILEDRKPVTFVIDNYKERDVESRFQYPGVKIISSSKRYGDHSLARHVIGYISDKDQIGDAGIEKAFNEELHIQKSQSIAMIGDAMKQSIPGLGYRVTNTHYDTSHIGVKLTLDYHIQKIVEDVMDENISEGAVIVTDIATGDILALASRPNYLQSNIENHIQSSGSELVNKAFSAYDLGSIFKIIVTAAALETRTVTPQTLFNCTGKIMVDGKEFRCSLKEEEGHGEIDFIQAFAYSCNASFIDIGLKLGYKPIVNMARRFGFGTDVDLSVDLVQKQGYIPDNMYVSSREIANISIGQGEILVTPLQVVDMITTIANDGVRKRLNIVEAVVSDNGDVKREVYRKDNTRIINADIAKEIQKMMHQVTISGTGYRANMEEYGGIAGKTGSAETGWAVEGETKVHAWFAGYFPVDNPQYAMVVFVENGRWGGTAAAPVFKDMAEQIIKLNR